MASLSVISLSDSDSEDIPPPQQPKRRSSPQIPTLQQPKRPSSPQKSPNKSPSDSGKHKRQAVEVRAFVIPSDDEHDEEYQEYLEDNARRRALRSHRRMEDRSRSLERHRLAAERFEQSAERHHRLARSAGKRVASSDYYTDPEFDSMIANVTINDDGGACQ